MIKEIRMIYYRAINFAIFKINGVKIPEGMKDSGIIYISNKGNVSIGKNFRFNSGVKFNPIGGDTLLRLVVKIGAELKLGYNCQISNSTIYCTNSITIGDNVQIGGSCKIYDTDFHAIDFQNRFNAIRENKEHFVKKGKIVIEDGVWIGGHCILLKGITIGKNSVIGAGSVVTKNIPPFEVWAGNPAKKIKNI